MNFKELYKPIAKEILLVEKRMKSVLRCSDKVLNDIINYILDSPGKRLRPALVLLSAKAFNKNITAKTIDLAVAVELIHIATLVQDDVIDSAKTRRGKPSVCRVFGDNVSILFGDYLYSKAFSVIAGLGSMDVILALSDVTNGMASGEISQLHYAGKIIGKKRDWERY